MERRRKTFAFKVAQLMVLIWCVVTLVNGQKGSSSSSKAKENPQESFKKNQKQLQELKKLAQDGGHTDPDAITKFDADVCYTRDCIEAAKEFLFATNFSENPCETGSWLKYTCLRRTMHTEGDDDLDDMYQQGQVGYVGSVAIGQTLSMLESKNVTTPVMQSAIDYYEQCEKWREGTSDDDKVEMITNYLKGFGDWPLLSGKETPGDEFDWQKLMANNVRIAVAYGVAPYLFDIFIEEGNVPMLFTGELSLHKDKGEIAEIIKILSNGKRDVTEDDEQIQEMKEFLANLTHPSEEKIEKYSLNNVTKNYDFGKNFDLLRFYSLMLDGTRVHITPDSDVSADFDWLVEHIKAINEANPRVVANILFLQAAAALLTRLTTLTHVEHLPTLERYRSNGPMDCMRETYEKFDYAMSHEYLEKYYDHNGTPALVQLMDNLKRGYVDVLEHADFLTSQTKVHAIDKANDIHTFIAADAWVMDEEKLQEYYTSMNISRNEDFVRNHVAGLRFHWSKFLGLTNANIFNYLVGDAYTGYVSAKYSYHFNQIRVQAALVQKPLFSYKYPGFMNYGGIGTVLSHTLAHSFDTNGVHFNKKGHRGDFWDDLSYEGYYNWTDSVIEDYGGTDYQKLDPWGSLVDANIDHSQAVNDDIADIVGVKMAYNAYNKYLDDLKKEGKNEKTLPGLKDFTPQQLFWMKYANMWCEHTKKSYVYALRTFHQHSPGNVRATLPLTRSKEWAADFKCPAPSKSDF